MSLVDDLVDGVVAGDVVITVRPVASTSGTPLRPNLVPGGDSHDAGLDLAAAEVAPRAPAPASGPTAGELQAAEDLDASLARARAGVVDEQLLPLPVPHDPLLDLRA